jgi:pimeloyl-ACP methyl ester carboxylesterase
LALDILIHSPALFQVSWGKCNHLLSFLPMVSSTPVQVNRYIHANRTWRWQQWDLPYLVAGTETAPPIVLIHGFGGCLGHWRHNVPVLAEYYRVYAIDLLGFGVAPKPGVSYTFELWGQQIVEFCRTVVGKPATLVGNSIGAIVALQAAVTDASAASSVVLLNCSLRLLHERKRSQLAWYQRLGTPILQRLLNVKPLGHFFFRQIAQPRSLRRILHQAYVRPAAVTDELVELLLAPARDEGAADVFLSFISYASGPLAEDLMPHLHCPVLILWGEDDPWEPLALGRSLGDYACVEDFAVIPDAGHCPMDEAPEEVNAHLLEWVAKVR